MGQQLLQLYQDLEKNKGFQAAVKVVMLTGMTKADAETAEDSPDNLSKVKDAIAKVEAQG